MKKNILFVIDSLYCAGAEKSLTTLLSLLNYNKYSVDLILFSHGGDFERFIPEEVTILRPFTYSKFAELSLFGSFIQSMRMLDFQMFNSRVNYSINLRKSKNNLEQEARIYWECISDVIEQNPKIYDTAISYAQGVPTFYVAEKVKAKEKFAWVNVSYRLDEDEKKFQRSYYDQFNKIVAVSESTKEILLETFPYYTDRTKVIYDINDPQLISRMSGIGESYEDCFTGLRILTIGRLAHQKGYDIALEVCKKLKDKGVNFKWYVLGKGPLKKEIEKYILANDLSDHFVLLGVKSNPYSFIKNADMYVQTSKFEGFGLAIAEARMLNVPVVTTRFDAVYSQMVDGMNGLVVDMNADAVTEGIMKLINDKKLRDSIVQYLKNEKKGNVEEIEKFYQLIG
ncbi:glycosyltransferase [Virgibacillus sp. DJP39]|uniref:glycosyltransferase n=1 Tax=Virgibacillus sp. DJP39 TaxID=3409790 RepID=UPI003BB7ED8B